MNTYMKKCIINSFCIHIFISMSVTKICIFHSLLTKPFKVSISLTLSRFLFWWNDRMVTQLLMKNFFCMACACACFVSTKKKLSLSSFDFATTYLLLWKLHYNLPKRFSQPCFSLTSIHSCLLLTSPKSSRRLPLPPKTQVFISNCIDFPVLPYLLLTINDNDS